MKDYLFQLLSKEKSFNLRLNLMREYLQLYILRIIYEAGGFRNISFLGGTALRFLYDLPRFSEYLDFSLSNREGFHFSNIIKKIKYELEICGYNVEVVCNNERNVKNAFIKFKELLQEAGISKHREQKLSIKIEIDSNPPEGARLETKIVNKYFPIAFLCYDIESLFSGKIHCILMRKYTKGRDYFDLGWFLSKWKEITPNFVLLNNALKQTGWKCEKVDKNNWRDLVLKKIQEVNWGKVKYDVENFLEREKDFDIFTKENLINLIKRY